MFKHILLPSDGSDAALRTARHIGARYGSSAEIRITVLVVVLPLDTASTDFDEEFVHAHNAQVHRQAQNALDRTIKALAEYDTTCTGKILEGNPVSAAIAAEAEAGDYDLIAISSRGMAAQRDKLHYMGSVTEHVIRRVHIPVLVFPVPDR